MSSTVETGGAVASPVEGEDTLGDDSRLDKKKKFKPFQKMKNFFRGSSKKRFKPDDGGQKSHSTSALHNSANSQEDDDDGGFRPKAAGLAGSRSISEDSIFKTDSKESKPGILENKTVSMENIDTNPFQSELFAKLRSRKSDSDIDEGLPYSPSTTLTHHGLMFDTKQKSVPTGGKSTSQESDQSLISMDSSSEDLFSSDWKSGVASVKKPRCSSVESITEIDMNVADFEAVQMRSTLSNEAAKHRISVAPKTRRLTAKMSVKKRDKSPAPLHLPDVKEESPTKVQPNTEIGEKQGAHKTVISTTIPVGSSSGNFIPRSEPRDIPGHADVTLRSEVKDMARSEPRDIPQSSRHDEDMVGSRPSSLSPLSTSPVSQSMLQEVKLRKRPVSEIESEGKKETDEPSDELAKAFDRAKRISKKFDEGSVADLGPGIKPNVMPVEKEVEIKPPVEVLKPTASSPKEENKPISVAKPTVSSPKEESKTIPVVSPVKDSLISPAVISPVSGVSFVLKKEPLRPATRTPSTETKEVGTTKPDTDTQPVLESPASVTVRTIVKDNCLKEVKLGETVTDETGSPKKTSRQGSPEKLSSPREDYKLKRAARSKTLPASKDSLDKTEDTEIKVSGGRLGSPPLGSRHRNNYENVVVNVKPSSTGTDSKRSSWALPTETGGVVAASEPAWVVRQRLKQMEQEKKNSEERSEKNDSAKEIKLEVKGVNQLKEDNPYMNVCQVKEENPYVNEVKEENTYMNVEPRKETEVTVNKAPAPSEQKADIPKGNVQAGTVKSWAQTYSAKPFEKPSVKTSVPAGATKTNVEKPAGVHSVKAPVTTDNTKTEQDSANKSTVSPSKPGVSASAKPVVATTSKPPLSASVKPAVTAASKPADATSSTNKTFSQSLNSKVSGFGGVTPSSSAGGFSRSVVQKPGVSVQKSGPDIKPLSQTSVKPSSVSKADSISSSSNNTQSIQDNKKSENDTKNAQTSTSTPKTGSSVDKGKTAFSAVSKPETSSAVPAWKQALNQKKNVGAVQPVKIEIIDKDENKSPKKTVEEKPAVQMREKPAPDKCSSSAANRPSKVLDMVKSFQKLQVT